MTTAGLQTLSINLGRIPVLSKEEVYEMLTKQRDHQDRKHADALSFPLGEWMLLIEDELGEAKEAFCRKTDRAQTLVELTHVAALCVACLEQHGGMLTLDYEDDPIIPPTNGLTNGHH